MSVIYIYVLDVKKNFYYISVSVQTKKNLHIYVRVRISVRTTHTSLCSTVCSEKTVYMRECEKKLNTYSPLIIIILTKISSA